MSLFPVEEGAGCAAPDGPPQATAAWATPFELARIRAVRAYMLYTGNAPRVSQERIEALAEATPCGVPDPVDVATLEVALGALPQVAVERVLPSGRTEVVPLSRLRLPDDQHFAWATIL